MPDEKKTRKLNVAVKSELLPWMDYAAGVSNTSVTGYINEVIERDLKGDTPLGADKGILEGYEAFLKMRDKYGKTPAED